MVSAICSLVSSNRVCVIVSLPFSFPDFILIVLFTNSLLDLSCDVLKFLCVFFSFAIDLQVWAVRKFTNVPLDCLCHFVKLARCSTSWDRERLVWGSIGRTIGAFRRIGSTALAMSHNSFQPNHQSILTVCREKEAALRRRSARANAVHCASRCSDSQHRGRPPAGRDSAFAGHLKRGSSERAALCNADHRAGRGSPWLLARHDAATMPGISLASSARGAPFSLEDAPGLSEWQVQSR